MRTFVLLAAIAWKGIEAGGTPYAVLNCTSNGMLTAEAVNCEDALPEYCASATTKSHYVPDTTYLKAAVGLAATLRIPACYSGGDVTTEVLAQNPSFVKAAVAKCAKTCGFCCVTPAYNCKNSDSPQINCENVTPDMCKDSKWRELIAVNCPNKCGFCLEGGCVDAAVDCDKDASICRKPDMSAFVAVNCKRTCGLCSSNPSSPSATTASSVSCADTMPNCANWVSNGFCSSTFYNTSQKKEWCGRSCKLC